jgi:hypothetical protein
MEEFVMHKKTSMAGIIILLATAILLAACSGSNSPAAPTGDANAVYTQAAATVSAGLTQTAVKNPAKTQTPVPPTATVENKPAATATATVEQPGPNNQPTATKAGGTQPTATKAGGTQPTATKAGGTQPTATKSGTVPTATKAAPPPSTTGDKAEWVSQSPTDKTQIQKSATFTMTYVLKNSGTKTWTKNYTLRYYAGSRLESPADINLISDVAPGENATITFTLIAPDDPGETNTVWVLTNADGANFYSVNLLLTITE